MSRVQIPARSEICFETSVPSAPLANSSMMNTLILHCHWKDETAWETTGHQPSNAEAKKMKALTLHAHGCSRRHFWQRRRSISHEATPNVNGIELRWTRLLAKRHQLIGGQIYGRSGQTMETGMSIIPLESKRHLLTDGLCHANRRRSLAVEYVMRG